MTLGTMKIDVTFLTRPHAFLVYGLLLLTFIAATVPSVQVACKVVALLFSIAMLWFVGRNCDSRTRAIELLNCGLCILLISGGILK